MYGQLLYGHISSRGTIPVASRRGTKPTGEHIGLVPDNGGLFLSKGRSPVVCWQVFGWCQDICVGVPRILHQTPRVVFSRGQRSPDREGNWSKGRLMVVPSKGCLNLAQGMPGHDWEMVWKLPVTRKTSDLCLGSWLFNSVPYGCWQVASGRVKSVHMFK